MLAKNNPVISCKLTISLLKFESSYVLFCQYFVIQIKYFKKFSATEKIKKKYFLWNGYKNTVSTVL